MTLSLISLLSQDISGLWLPLRTSTGACGQCAGPGRAGGRCMGGGLGLLGPPHVSPTQGLQRRRPVGPDSGVQAGAVPAGAGAGAVLLGWGRIRRRCGVGALATFPPPWNQGAHPGIWKELSRGLLCSSFPGYALGALARSPRAWGPAALRSLADSSQRCPHGCGCTRTPTEGCPAAGSGLGAPACGSASPPVSVGPVPAPGGGWALLRPARVPRNKDPRPEERARPASPCCHSEEGRKLILKWFLAGASAKG